jgi:hypothetical protein
LLRVFCYWLATFIFIKKMCWRAFGVAMIVKVVPLSIAAEVLVILKKDTAVTI